MASSALAPQAARRSVVVTVVCPEAADAAFSSAFFVFEARVRRRRTRGRVADASATVTSTSGAGLVVTRSFRSSPAAE